MHRSPLIRVVCCTILITASTAASAQDDRASAVTAFREHVNARATFTHDAGTTRLRDTVRITGAQGCVLDVAAGSSNAAMEEESTLLLDLATVAPGSAVRESSRHTVWKLRLSTAPRAPEWTLRRVTRFSGMREDRREARVKSLDIPFARSGDAETGRALLERAVAVCSSPPAPVVAAAPAAPAQPAATQAPAAEPSPAGTARITGFNRFNWGTRRAAIQARDGAPRHTQNEPGGVVMLNYRETVFGEEAQVFYSVHPTHGLYFAGYVVEPRPGADCEAMLRKFEQAVAERYPDITPQRRRNNDSSIGFCDAVTIGRARSLTSWTDPTGARIGVGIAAESRNIIISYASPEYPRILGQQNAAERDQRF